MTRGETSRSVERALDIIETFLTHDELTLGEIAELTGMQKSVARRHAVTLVNRGYMVQRQKRGKYSLSSAYLNFSGVVKRRFRLRSVGIPYFLSLSRQIHETVTVAYVSDVSQLDQAVTETFYDTSEDSRMFAGGLLSETAGMPLWCTSLGNAILAKLPQPLLDSYLNNVLSATYPPEAVVDFDRLLQSLERARTEGVAIEDGEFMEGIRGVASGIDGGRGGMVGAVGVVGPALYLTHERILAIAPAVKSCALAVTQALMGDVVGRDVGASWVGLPGVAPTLPPNIRRLPG